MRFETELVEVDPQFLSKNLIEKKTRWIKEVEIKVFLTETVYGLGADVARDSVVKKIYQTKDRPADNSLIAHFVVNEDIQPYVQEIPDIEYRLAAIFWIGSLTFILMKTDIISPVVTQRLDTLPVWIPSHQVALPVIEKSEVPIAAT